MAKKKALEPHELRKILRQAILDSGKTVYQLHVESRTLNEPGMDQGQIHKFMNEVDTDMKGSSMERLCRVLGLELRKIDDSECT